MPSAHVLRTVKDCFEYFVMFLFPQNYRITRNVSNIYRSNESWLNLTNGLFYFN